MAEILSLLLEGIHLSERYLSLKFSVLLTPSKDLNRKNHLTLGIPYHLRWQNPETPRICQVK